MYSKLACHYTSSQCLLKSTISAGGSGMWRGRAPWGRWRWCGGLWRVSTLCRHLYSSSRWCHCVCIHVHRSNGSSITNSRMQSKAPSTPVEATMSNATSRTILSTKSNVASTLLPFLATMSNEISCFRQSRNILNMFNLFRLC